LIDTQIQLAHDLAAAGEPDEALRIASSVLNENPDEARALFLASYVFLQAERYGMAYNMLKRAADIVPKREQVWNNLGMCCMKMNRIDEARRHLNRALQLNRENYAALNNLALIEVNEGNPVKALQLGKQSLAIDEEQWDVQETMGYASLMLGDWLNGWEGYEAMVGNTKQRTAEPRKPVPYWDGRKVERILVRGEQGIGDEISFASVLNDVKPKVVLECDRRLEGLFKRSFPNIEIHGTRFDKSVHWDAAYEAWCLIGSLPWHYRTRDEHFSGKPYLKADPERKLQWKALLDSLGTKKKIGIAWTGGLKDTHGERRSLELEQLLPILQQDATFISLQYKTPQELADFEQQHGIKIHHWARATETHDYDDTAALVDELDLVISVQTAVVHLAGALGKTTWVLVPNKPHWRYATTRFMWAESVEMFRQGKTWGEPIKAVSERLGAFLGPG
jgi:hypothetical protein